MADAGWGSAEGAKRMNYDYRERIGALVNAFDALARALEISIRFQTGGPRAEADALLKEAREFANTAGYEL